MDLSFAQLIDFTLRLVVAMIAGTLLSVGRPRSDLRLELYASVSVGAALFVTVGEAVVSHYIGTTSVDPLMVVGAVVVAIGLLAAALVAARGASTAAVMAAVGLLMAAAVGIASGFGLYGLVIVALVMVMLMSRLMWQVEDWIAHRFPAPPSNS